MKIIDQVQQQIATTSIKRKICTINNNFHWSYSL